jgi:6-phosphogluconolactonase
MKPIVLASLMLLLAGCAGKSRSVIPDNRIFLFIGTYTNTGSEGIYRVDFDTVTGAFGVPELAVKVENPSFLTIDEARNFMYAISELNSGNGMLHQYSIDVFGHLAHVKSVSTGGNGPCYVSVLPGDSIVAFANYGAGSVGFSYSEWENGLAESQWVIPHTGADEQGNVLVARAHCIASESDDVLIYASDLGLDQLRVYRMEDNQPFLHQIVALKQGDGPRHFEFYPRNELSVSDTISPFMALITEYSNQVYLFSPDSLGCYSVLSGIESTLPHGFEEKSFGADIHFSPDGNFLYASNRGHNSIAVFKVDVTNKRVTPVDWTTDGINWPRNFGIDPSGNFLLVANQKGDNVTVYRRNAITGTLTLIDHNIKLSSPVCIRFVEW